MCRLIARRIRQLNERTKTLQARLGRTGEGAVDASEGFAGSFVPAQLQKEAQRSLRVRVASIASPRSEPAGLR